MTSKRHPQHKNLPAFVLFVGQRLLFGLFVLLAITFLCYLGLDMAEGAALRRALPGAAAQTALYVHRFLQGDLGTSTAGSLTYAVVSVSEVVPQFLARSLGLLAVSLLVAVGIGAPIGFWAAKRRHTHWSLLILLTSIVGVSVPSFFAALLLQLGLIRWTRTFGKALLPVGGFGWDERIILPALVLAARPIAQIARVTFVSIGETLDQDHVRTAHSKGLAQQVVMGRHVLRNAAIPILTTIGISLRFSLSSLPVVEFFFNWTGMGFTLLKSIARRDDNLTIALVLCLGALFVLVNLGLELFYRLIDPRLRDQIARSQAQERESALELLKSALAGMRDGLRNALHRLLPARWRAHQGGTAPSPFRAALERRNIEATDAQKHKAERRRAWARGTLGNLPFALGALLVGLLAVLFVFGPSLTPHSPYTKRGLEYSDGELTVPPFEPDDVYPWGTDPLGRDIQSLILSGAQQTLLLAILVVTARLLLGILLGSLAGWLSGSWLDRAVLGMAEVLAAFPALLLAMTLILALGIRAGLRPFVIALSLIGWGEIMQYVRSEVLSIRVKPFVESATATGLRTPRIVVSHVLPNLLPSLISLAALEMGAVLMLLGELGFVGIFIGGGAFAELQIDAPPYHYSDVPEWAALLSNTRLYARSYPWTAVYPALAFFVSILGFNLLGEGLRRLIERVGVGFTRLINRYTLALGLLAVLGASWIQGYTGSTAIYRQQAAAFDGEHALTTAKALADPILAGRALGNPGLQAAAERIAQSYADAGLQPAGENMGYYQRRERSYQSLDAVPQLRMDGQDSSWVYRQDYAEYPGPYRNVGQVSGSVEVLLFGEQTWVRSTYSQIPKGLGQVDLAGKTFLVLSEREIVHLSRIGLNGLLVVAEDETDLTRRYTLSTRDPTWSVYGTGRQVGRDFPCLWLSPTAADRLLAGSGHTVQSLRRQYAQLEQDEVQILPTGTTVSMNIQSTHHEKVPVQHVIGHLPGESDSRYGGLNNQAIVVLAQYDSPPVGPEGTLHPGANDNAAGVALLSEVVRTMRETGYQPYRTLLFIAYSGEGLEGGEPVNPSDITKFLQAKTGFVSSLDVEAIVHLRGLGGAEGKTLKLAARGSRRLAKLFERSARQMGVRAQQAQEPVDLSIVFEDKSRMERGQEAPEILLTWEDWQTTSRTARDTVESLSESQLERAGRALTMALMVLGREIDY